MKQSKRFELNRADVEKWVKNALIFAGPLLIVVIPSIIGQIPSDWKYAAITIYILNTILDFIRKYIAGPKQ